MSPLQGSLVWVYALYTGAMPPPVLCRPFRAHMVCVDFFQGLTPLLIVCRHYGAFTDN